MYYKIHLFQCVIQWFQYIYRVAQPSPLKSKVNPTWGGMEQDSSRGIESPESFLLTAPHRVEALYFSPCALLILHNFFKEIFGWKFMNVSIIQLVYQAVGFSRLLVAIVMDCLEMFRQV